MRNYHLKVVMAVDERCTASGRALQAESAASQNITWENTFAEYFAKSSMHERRFAVMSSLQYLFVVVVSKGRSTPGQIQTGLEPRVYLFTTQVCCTSWIRYWRDVLSQHWVSSSKAVRLHALFGARCIEHSVRM